MNSDTNGWEVIRHPDEAGLRSLAHDEGDYQICYDEGPLSPAQMRNLAAALLRGADEAEHGEVAAASTEGAILAAAFSILQREAREGRSGLEPEPEKTLHSLLRAIDRAEGRAATDVP